MQWNGKSEQAGVEKKEADYTEKGFAIFEIDFSPRWDKWRKDLWIDNEIEQGEISPVGGEKWFHAENPSEIDRRS